MSKTENVSLFILGYSGPTTVKKWEKDYQVRGKVMRYTPAGFEAPVGHLSRVPLLGLDPSDIWLHYFRTNRSRVNYGKQD